MWLLDSTFWNEWNYNKLRSVRGKPDLPVQLLGDSYVLHWSLQQQHHQRWIQLPLALQSLSDRTALYTTSTNWGRYKTIKSLNQLCSKCYFVKLEDREVHTWTSCGRNTSNSPSDICSKNWTAALRTVWSWKLKNKLLLLSPTWETDLD